MNNLITALVAILVVAGIIVAVYTFHPDFSQGSGKVNLIPVKGLGSGSVELINCNEKTYLVAWSMTSKSLYIVPMNGTKSVNLTSVKPVWVSKLRWEPYADMVCHAGTLYVGISKHGNTTNTSVIVEVSMSNMKVSTMQIPGKTIGRLFYAGSLYMDAWYGNSYHIDRVMSNGSTEEIYSWSNNATPIQERMFLHNGTLYYSATLVNRGVHTYEILTFSREGAKIVWKYTKNPGFGYTTVVNGKLFTYLLVGSGSASKTLLYEMYFNGSIAHQYTLLAKEFVHYHSGVFIAGLKNIAYSQDGLHFTNAYNYPSEYLPAWQSKAHTTSISGNWLYELAFDESSGEEQYSVIALNMEGVSGF